MWQQDKSADAPGRLENPKELIAALAEFETLAGVLEHVSLVMENQDSADGDMATLMTLHGAKGLEFDIVFLPGWEEGLFPSQRTMDESGIAGLEEAQGRCVGERQWSKHIEAAVVGDGADHQRTGSDALQRGRVQARIGDDHGRHYRDAGHVPHPLFFASLRPRRAPDRRIIFSSVPR